MIQWKSTTEQNFNHMLGAVPPASQANSYRAFQVGEATSLNSENQWTFETFKVENGKFFMATKPATFEDFKPEFPTATYDYPE